MQKILVIIVLLAFLTIAPNYIFSQQSVITSYYRLSTPGVSVWTPNPAPTWHTGGFLNGQWENAGGSLVDFQRWNSASTSANPASLSINVWDSSIASTTIKLASFEAIVYRANLGTAGAACNSAIVYTLQVTTYGLDNSTQSYSTSQTTTATTQYATQFDWQLIKVDINDERPISRFVSNITWSCAVSGTKVIGAYLQSLTATYESTESLPIYTTPLKSTDEVSITDNNGNTVATATRPFLPVHAPYGGTVTSITPLDSDDCTGLGVSSITCSTISQSGSSLVTLSLSDGLSYQYIMVASYISEGDTITQGCVMGESTQSIGLVVSTIPITYFTDDPPENAQNCKDMPSPDRCLNDGLSNESAWYKQGTVTWGDEVILGIGGRIYQIMAIPANSRARLTIMAKGGQVIARLGNSTTSIVLADDAYTSIQIPFDYHEPNLADFYEISVRNNGGSDTYISSVCLDIEDDQNGENGGGDDYTIPDNPCYFRDFGFSDTTEWALTGGAEYDTGWVIIPSGGGVAQMVALHATEWSLSVDIALIYDDTFDFDANASESIQVSFVFPLDNPPTYNDLPVVTVGDIGDDVAYRIDTNFTITENDEGDFYIEISYPTLSGLDGIAITRACLRPSDGDWGDNPPPDDGLPFSEYCEVISPPRGDNVAQWIRWHWHNLSQFFECDLMVTLNNTYGLLRWFQAVLMLFMQWFGDLGVWLNGHFQNVITAILAGDSITTYEMPSNVDAGGFGISFPSGLSGIQSEPDSPQSGESCNWYDVFCHGRNLVGGVINFAGGILSDVVSVLVNFIGALLAQIVDLITLGYRTYIEPIVNLWNDFWAIIGQVKDTIVYIIEGENNFVSMWNDTEPVPPPGLQDCSEFPETKTLCLIYLVIDNTLLSGDWGALIIPLLSSIIGIFGLQMIIANFMQLVRTAKDA